MATRKRTRSSLKENESDSDYEESSEEYEESEEEYVPSPPPKKRQKRTPRRRNTKKVAIEQKTEEQEDEEEEDEDEESDIENTNTSNSNNKIPSNWKSKMDKLQKENVALKKENAALKKEIKSLKLKSSKAALKASKPAINGKKYFAGFAKSLIRIAKLKKTRFYGFSSVISVEQTLDKEDFDYLFDGKGHKIQPTPHNKPKSVKTIIQFSDFDDVEKLFSEYGVTLNQEIDISLWHQGSIFRGKSCFLRKDKAEIDGLTVEYNKSSRTLKLNFSASRGFGDARLFFF